MSRTRPQKGHCAKPSTMAGLSLPGELTMQMLLSFTNETEGRKGQGEEKKKRTSIAKKNSLLKML